MVGETLYDITVAFSLIAGSAAGLLSLLTWEVLRRSPFGRAIFMLSFVMVLFILYHVLLLISPTPPAYIGVFKSVLFTGVTLFIWMLVWSQYRLRTQPRVEQGSS